MTDVRIDPHFVLLYELVDDYVARRAAHRDDHLRNAAEYRRRGFVMGGAVGDPPDRAILVFSDRSAAESFAHDDPYVRAGLVRRWEVQPWAVVAADVFDEYAATPG
jgi:hypothetical protein